MNWNALWVHENQDFLCAMCWIRCAFRLWICDSIQSNINSVQLFISYCFRRTLDTCWVWVWNKTEKVLNGKYTRLDSTKQSQLDVEVTKVSNSCKDLKVIVSDKQHLMVHVQKCRCNRFTSIKTSVKLKFLIKQSLQGI